LSVKYSGVDIAFDYQERYVPEKNYWFAATTPAFLIEIIWQKFKLSGLCG